MRAKLSDLSNTRLPQVLGNCAGNLPAIASYVNEATQRLIMIFGENGFWGAWAKVLFNVNRTDPYITLPSAFARAVNLDVCRAPWSIKNEWYEVIEDGIGLQKICPMDCRNTAGAYDRNFYPTAYDLTPTNQLLRVYASDSRDIGQRILISGALDQNGLGIYTADGINNVQGFYLTLGSPFTTSDQIITAFQSISKQVTYGDVILRQVDADTGVEVTLARFGPQETNPQYRRYFLQSLPCACCPNPNSENTQVQVTAMLKYEFRPVVQPSDFMMTGNIPGLKMMCEAIRYQEMDTQAGINMGLLKEQQAIKLFNQELTHYLGDESPAVSVSPGWASNAKAQGVGMM